MADIGQCHLRVAKTLQGYVEVCPVNKSHIGSLQYVVDNCLRKIFDVKLTETVRECMKEFNWLTMCDMIDMTKSVRILCY